MSLSISFCIDLIPFSIEFKLDVVPKCFSRLPIYYIHVSTAPGTKKITARIKIYIYGQILLISIHGRI